MKRTGQKSIEGIGLRLLDIYRVLPSDGFHFTLSLFAASLAVAGIQIFLLAHVWDWIVHLAAEQGRTMRGDIAFGLTIYYSSRYLYFGFLIASPLAAAVSRSAVRWALLGSVLIPWSMLVVPSFSSYPIRGASFYLLGASLLLIGSGVIIPILRKHLAKPVEQPLS